jgi:hypothetical protein
MWTVEERDAHKEKCKLQGRQLQVLPLNVYKLRQRWPAYLQSLHPMTLEMLNAGNNVY